MDGSFGRTAVLAVLLAVLCVACDRANEGSGDPGNGIGPINAQGAKTEDIARSGGLPLGGWR